MPTTKSKKSKPKKYGELGKVKSELIEFLYHNDDKSMKELMRINLSGKKRPKHTVEDNLKELIDKDIVEKIWHSRIPAFRDRRYDEVHYALTRKGFDIAEELPRIKARIEERDREYREDAENYRRNH